jgi:CheY-like chemotaxis protein/glycine cleavage system H lipoate-binding protein
VASEIDVLVIDDEDVVLDGIARICSAEGMTVGKAKDGATGLQTLATSRCKLVVCDIMMPEMDGFQVLDQVQRRFPETPVIISTGFSTVENAVRSLYAGAIDFIPKPFTADELLSSLTRGLRYREIVNLRRSGATATGDPRMFTVPCPARYYRLGYMSWVVTESDGTALIGVSHAFARTVDMITAFDLVGEQEELVQGIQCAQVRTAGGLVHSVLSPVSGKVIGKNPDLETDPHVVEKDPYFAGWLYRVIPTEPEYELAHLTPCGADMV